MIFGLCDKLSSANVIVCMTRAACIKSCSGNSNLCEVFYINMFIIAD